MVRLAARRCTLQTFDERDDMTRDPRLELIPGTKRHRDTRDASTQMAFDALRDLPFIDALKVIEAHLAGRPDIDAYGLEQFSNRVGRLAHMEAR